MRKQRLVGTFAFSVTLLVSGCSGGSGGGTGFVPRSATVTVGATACPWLAGMPNGSLGVPYAGAQAGTGNDTAPTESPVLVSGIPIAPGRTLTFSATGTVTYSASFTDPYISPDGDATLIFGTGKDYSAPSTQPLLSYDGMSGVYAPAGALMGVFLSDSVPSAFAAPAFTDYTTIAARDFTTAAPALRQVFYIGDGITSTGAVQTFVVPAGATRLYLGTMDGFGWSDDAGAFSVTVNAIN